MILYLNIYSAASIPGSFHTVIQLNFFVNYSLIFFPCIKWVEFFFIFPRIVGISML